MHTAFFLLLLFMQYCIVIVGVVMMIMDAMAMADRILSSFIIVSFFPFFGLPALPGGQFFPRTPDLYGHKPPIERNDRA